MYCLAKNPDVQEKLYEEVQSVLPNKEAITPETLNKLPYIKAVIKETFRYCLLCMNIQRAMR